MRKNITAFFLGNGVFFKLAVLFVAVVLVGSGLAGAAENTPGKPVARLTVDAGKTERIDTPVTAELPAGFSLSGVRLVEVVDDNRLPVPFQAAKEAKGEKLCWILSGKNAAGAKRVFELEKGKPVEVKGIEVAERDSAFEVTCGDKAVLRYKYGVEPAPNGTSKNYEKSGFIHPVWSPAGQVLTQIHPGDHIHHMGLWNAWTATEFEKRHVDFWNIKDGKGTVRFAKSEGKVQGPVFGGFRVMQEHVDLSAPGGAKVALNEDLEVRVWNTGGAGKGYWIFDWISIQRCASASPLKLLKYRYGGLGFRATMEWGVTNSEYLTAEGKTRKDGNGSRECWGIMSGKTAKGAAGLVMMTCPGNREYPEPVRIWGSDNREGHIFFNFCPIQQKEWTMEPGNDYVFRYRMCAFDGEMSRETAERLWSDFGNPPEVRFEKLAE